MKKNRQKSRKNSPKMPNFRTKFARLDPGFYPSQDGFQTKKDPKKLRKVHCPPPRSPGVLLINVFFGWNFFRYF